MWPTAQLGWVRCRQSTRVKRPKLKITAPSYRFKFTLRVTDIFELEEQISGRGPVSYDIKLLRNGQVRN